MQKMTFRMMAMTGALLGAACGGFVDGTGETGYRNIGNEGGEVKARDTVVSVPVGAVDQATTLTITPAPDEELPEGAAGRAIDLGPDALEFREAVSVQLRFEDERLPDATRRDLVWVGTVVDGEWEPLRDGVVDEVSRLARGSTRRSGRFGVVHGCGRGRRCPVALEFVTRPQHIRAGECSELAELKTVDWSGRTSPVRHDTLVALSADDQNTHFFADAGCVREINSLTIPTLQSSGRFYFRGRVARSLTLTAQARDLRPASQEASITVGSTISFSFLNQQQRVASGACSAAELVAFEDSFGNRAPLPNDARLILTASGTSTVTFYSDAQCATATSGITMPAGSASTSFWFKADLTTPNTVEVITLHGNVGAFEQGFSADQPASIYLP